MHVNNNLQGLQQMFANQEVTRAKASEAGQNAAGAAGKAAADQATLSPAASLAAQALPDADVRMDKVAAVQQALAAGTYNVPAADVAGKLIATMLSK